MGLRSSKLKPAPSRAGERASSRYRDESASSARSVARAGLRGRRALHFARRALHLARGSAVARAPAMPAGSLSHRAPLVGLAAHLHGPAGWVLLRRRSSLAGRAALLHLVL